MVTVKIIMLLFLSFLLVICNLNIKEKRSFFSVLTAMLPFLKKTFLRTNKFWNVLKRKLKTNDSARKFYILIVVALMFSIQIVEYFTGEMVDENKYNIIDLTLKKVMEYDEILYQYEMFHVDKLHLIISEVIMFSLILFNFRFANWLLIRLHNIKIRMICFAFIGIEMVFFNPQYIVFYETILILLYASNFYCRKEIAGVPPGGLVLPILDKKQNLKAA